MAHTNRKVPLARRPSPVPNGDSDMRPSTRGLMGAIDQAHPSFIFVAAELQRMRRIGVELDGPSIQLAIEHGHSKYAEHLEDREARRAGRIPESIVYYARRGQLVKIGTTSKPHQRFASLLPDEVLAWEPGGRPEETERHAQFRLLRVSTSAEYFRRDASLDAHIAEVRDTHGAPHPDWPTLGSLAKRPRRLRLPEVPVTPHLVTLHEGTRLLGIRLGTARVWIHRGKLHHAVEGARGEKLYFLSDLRLLKERRKG